MGRGEGARRPRHFSDTPSHGVGSRGAGGRAVAAVAAAATPSSTAAASAPYRVHHRVADVAAAGRPPPPAGDEGTGKSRRRKGALASLGEREGGACLPIVTWWGLGGGGGRSGWWRRRNTTTRTISPSRSRPPAPCALDGEWGGRQGGPRPERDYGGEGEGEESGRRDAAGCVAAAAARSWRPPAAAGTKIKRRG